MTADLPAEWVTAAAEAIEVAAWPRIGRDLGTIHRDEIVAAGLRAALPLIVESIAAGFDQAARDADEHNKGPDRDIDIVLAWECAARWIRDRSGKGFPPSLRAPATVAAPSGQGGGNCASCGRLLTSDGTAHVGTTDDAECTTPTPIRWAVPGCPGCESGRCAGHVDYQPSAPVAARTDVAGGREPSAWIVRVHGAYQPAAEGRCANCGDPVLFNLAIGYAAHLDADDSTRCDKPWPASTSPTGDPR